MGTTSFTLNGEPGSIAADSDTLLIEVLRDKLALTGTKLVCGSGVCGACTVLRNGEPVVSCLLPVAAAVDARIGAATTQVAAQSDCRVVPQAGATNGDFRRRF